MASASQPNAPIVAQLSSIRKAMHVVDTYPFEPTPSRGSAAAGAAKSINDMAHQAASDRSAVLGREIYELHKSINSPSAVPPTQIEGAAAHAHFCRRRLLAQAARVWDQHLAASDPMLVANEPEPAQGDAPLCFGDLGDTSAEAKYKMLAKYPLLKKALKPLAPPPTQQPQIQQPQNHPPPNVQKAPLPRPQSTLGGINMGSAQPKAGEGGFITATDQFNLDVQSGKIPAGRPALGLKRNPQQPSIENVIAATHKNTSGSANGQKKENSEEEHPIPPILLLPDGTLDPRLEGLEPKLLAQVAMEILDSKGAGTEWSDIAGLQHAKDSVEEAIVWPLLNPDLFTGLRDPPRGLLLFGPPGTGKTMIARAIASRAGCTFMNISASSLMSKWVGEGEKLVRCMFAVACVKQPTVVFIDEIDSLLSMRSEGEMDAVRRVKTEFLVQMDGVGTDRNDRVLLIGATNRPEELDEAARRRMEKRLYIPLPDAESRTELIRRLIGTHTNSLTSADFELLGSETDGYSGADIKGFCREAAMGPVRALKRNAANNASGARISSVSASDVRPVSAKDCTNALKRIKPSVGCAELVRYEKWNDQYGSFPLNGANEEDDDES